MGKVALKEMDAFNYDARLSTGAVAAGGTLGILIPPSTGFVVYAILTEQSIGRMFAAALIPGILATALYIGAIWVRTQRNPLLGPADKRIDWPGRLKALKNVWPVAVLFGVVIGGIYLGWFSQFINFIIPGEITLTNIMFYIAVFHSAFNVVNMLVFLPFIGLLERVSIWLVPKGEDSVDYGTQYLEKHLLETPTLALEQVYNDHQAR